MFESAGLIEKLESTWHKVMGVVLTIILILGISEYLREKMPITENSNYYFVFLYFAFTVLILLIWLYSTGRLVYRGNNDFVIALIPRADTEDEAKNTIQCIHSSINELNQSSGLSKVKLVSLPCNFCKNDAHLKKYMEKNCKNLDCVVSFFINTGNQDNTLKNEVVNINFYLNGDSVSNFLNLSGNIIDFLREIKIQNFHKKWEIFESNSFDDRKKFKSNVKDLINHSIGILYLNKGEFEKSVDIFEEIFRSEQLLFNVTEDKEDGKRIILSPKIVSQSRVIYLLAHLYFKISDELIWRE